jgi:hypothetical protein
MSVRSRIFRRRSAAWLVVTLLGALWSIALPAAGSIDVPGFSIQRAPAWLDRAPLPRSGNAPILLHRSILDHESKTSAVDFAIRVDEPGRLAHASNVKITFDPNYQQLVLHELTLVRGGRESDALPSARIEAVRAEDTAQQLIYTGHLTVTIMLKDVRLGDVVRYRASTIGHNPIFSGRLHYQFALQSGVDKQRREIVVRARRSQPTLARSWLHCRNAEGRAARQHDDVHLDRRECAGARL